MDEHYLKRELDELWGQGASLFAFMEEGSLDGVWFRDLEDPAHEWRSPRFWEALGYEASGHAHLFEERARLLVPEDLVEAEAALEAHCADPAVPYECVLRYRNHSGVLVWMQCRGVAIRDEAGRPRRMLGVQRDLRAARRGEAQRLASLMSALPGWAVVFSEDGYYKEVITTREKIRNESSSIVGKHLREIMPPSEAEKMEFHMQEVLRTKQPQTFDYFWRAE